MALPPLQGHQAARSRLGSAILRGRLPQLVLITGPTGVGRQRLALWTAQLLFCERPAAEPCGTCRACRLVDGLAHPDLHWMMPVPRPKATEPDKQVEELADALAEQLGERRKNPLYGAPDGLAGHFVSTARLINRRAALKPVEGRVQVFIIGFAERLVPQESSPEAANALLKLLEEPAPGTYFFLTAEDAEAVLPTIRSRTVHLRLGRLPDSEVRDFLALHMGPEALDQRVARAGGVIGRALEEESTTAKAERAALAFLQAVKNGGTEPWEAALRQGPFAARGDFTRTLDAMADLLNQAAREGLGVLGRDTGLAGLATVPPERLVAALDSIGEAREQAQGNLNPQLLLAVLGQELAGVL